MRLIPLGAAGEVTGSAYYVIAEQGRLLIDCGMFQGGPDTEAKNASLPVKVDELDGVLVTHAHLDHTGRLPLLVKRGYEGPLYATEATVDLSGLVTADSARIQEWDAKEAKRERNGDTPEEPLYTEEDAAAAQRLFQGVPFDQPVEVLPGTSARWVEAGHLLGSASIELTVEENGRRTVIVFSGDIGPTGKPLIRDAEPLHYADVVLLESTYGARDHRSARESAAEAVELINRTVERKGKILVPAFALGRTQELIYAAVGLFHNNRAPEFPIYVDSLMAIEATEVFVKHPDLMDEETMALVESGELAEDLTAVHATRSPAESRQLNDMPGPMMIIAASGMCTGGRILHHLLHNLAGDGGDLHGLPRGGNAGAPAGGRCRICEDLWQDHPCPGQRLHGGWFQRACRPIAASRVVRQPGEQPAAAAAGPWGGSQPRGVGWRDRTTLGDQGDAAQAGTGY